MDFGDKLRKIRNEFNMTQTELANSLDVTLRTIQNYEANSRLPKNKDIYFKIADLFDVDVNYFLTVGDEFIQDAREKYGSIGEKDARELIRNASSLFAGGSLSEADKEAVLLALQEAYYTAKRENKKYAPKKFR